MSEKDFDNEDTQQGIVPEHLRYIDEKEALEHKLQNLDLEEYKTDTFEPDSDLLNNSVAPTFPLDKQANVPPTLLRSRFTSKVPDHFICKICANVVDHPLECISCENLLCKICIETTDNCPFGCETFKSKPIAKFAQNVYQSLYIDCKNKPFGCSFNTTVKNIFSHEETCLYVITQCENPFCDRFILKKDRMKDPGEPLLCSEICENVLRFSLIIDENNKFETLQNFTALSERCKKLIEYEVKSEMQDKYKKIEERRKIVENYKKRKEKTEKDIIAWKNYQHPGKWNIRTSKWTCCGYSEIYTIGCKLIP
jgi:hypothetical protein